MLSGIPCGNKWTGPANLVEILTGNIHLILKIVRAFPVPDPCSLYLYLCILTILYVLSLCRNINMKENFSQDETLSSASCAAQQDHMLQGMAVMEEYTPCSLLH